MSRYVVDASVVVKWFVPEEGSEAAALLLSGEHELLAPDLLGPELGNVLWKKHRRGELATNELRDVLAAFALVPIEIVPTRPYLESACACAVAAGVTVYDALYVALAVGQGCPLVTADLRLREAVAQAAIEVTVEALR